MILLQKHTKAQIITALQHGVPVWRLNKNIDGFDDIRIGPAKECKREVIEEEGRDMFLDHPPGRGWQLIEFGLEDKMPKTRRGIRNEYGRHNPYLSQ